MDTDEHGCGPEARVRRRLFLFGDRSDNFPTVTAPFVAAAGGPGARIAFLTTGGPDAERHLPEYRDPWLALGAEVLHIAPAGNGCIQPRDLERLQECAGIFMCGGDPRHYQRLYAEAPVGPIIRERYRAGIPYAGVSAGALLVTETSILVGDRVTAPSNECRVRAVYPEACELLLGAGLGLLPDCIVDAHLAERGSLPRLLAAMQQAGAPWGLGIDEPACLHVTDEKQVCLLGQGRAYIVRLLDPQRFELHVLEPGQNFALASGRCWPARIGAQP